MDVDPVSCGASFPGEPSVPSLSAVSPTVQLAHVCSCSSNLVIPPVLCEEHFLIYSQRGFLSNASPRFAVTVINVVVWVSWFSRTADTDVFNKKLL